MCSFHAGIFGQTPNTTAYSGTIGGMGKSDWDTTFSGSSNQSQRVFGRDSRLTWAGPHP